MLSPNVDLSDHDLTLRGKLRAASSASDASPRGAKSTGFNASLCLCSGLSKSDAYALFGQKPRRRPCGIFVIVDGKEGSGDCGVTGGSPGF